MRNSFQPRACAIFLGFVLLVACCLPAAAEDNKQLFSDEINAVLVKKNEEIKPLLSDPTVLKAVHDASVVDTKLSLKEILALDKKYQTASDSEPWMQSFKTNACAQRLLGFQKDHPGYAEIFITDVAGLNVCQTDKTSDYYQADEEWWLRAFEREDGQSTYGDIEFDESAHSQAISIYLPILDGEPRRIVGVAKAVVDLNQIKEEL